MARPIESQLYQELTGSCFNFIERGMREINEIYDCVQHRFPLLCDDEFHCQHQQHNGIHQAEWKHIVRSALGRCKIKSDTVHYTGNRGFNCSYFCNGILPKGIIFYHLPLNNSKRNFIQPGMAA